MYQNDSAAMGRAPIGRIAAIGRDVGISPTAISAAIVAFGCALVFFGETATPAPRLFALALPLIVAAGLASHLVERQYAAGIWLPVQAAR